MLANGCWLQNKMCINNVSTAVRRHLEQSSIIIASSLDECNRFSMAFLNIFIKTNRCESLLKSWVAIKKGSTTQKPAEAGACVYTFFTGQLANFFRNCHSHPKKIAYRIVFASENCG